MFFYEFCEIFKNIFFYSTASEALRWWVRSITAHTSAYQRLRNVSFSENFAYVLNEWPLNAIFLVSSLKRKNCIIIIIIMIIIIIITYHAVLEQAWFSRHSAYFALNADRYSHNVLKVRWMFISTQKNFSNKSKKDF